MEGKENRIVEVKLFNPIAAAGAVDVYKLMKRTIVGECICVSSAISSQDNSECRVLVTGRHIKTTDPEGFQRAVSIASGFRHYRKEMDLESYEFMFKLFSR